MPTIGIAIDIPQPWGGQLTSRRASAGDPAAEYVPGFEAEFGVTAFTLFEHGADGPWRVRGAYGLRGGPSAGISPSP